MKRILLAALVLSAIGCGGDSSSLTAARFAGTYQGTWVNLDDASDHGTSTWTYSPNGNVTGQDFDPGRDTTFNVVGTIDKFGNLTSVSTPTSGDPASLNGPLAFDSSGNLTGILTWGVSPALHYRYTFSKTPVF